MSTMERSEYPEMLAKLSPGQAVDVLNDRVRQIGKLNVAVADWLQERRQLEEQYANGLRRLARHNLDAADLGVFSVPWTTIASSLDTIADSHSTLAAKLETELERPLRDFPTKAREMQAITTSQGNLAALARDVEKAQQKAEKLQGKSTNKIADASSDLDNAQVQWQSQAPYVFERLQLADETRLDQLRDFLTQAQTIELDQAEKHKVAAEHVLNILLNVETKDEIATFAIKSVAAPGRASTSRGNRSSLAPIPASVGRSNFGASSTDLTPIQSNPDEDAAPRASSMQEEGNDEKKGPLKGLKRLGTVLGRRRSKMPAGPLPPMSESPERKPKPSRFGIGRSKSSYSSEQGIDETGQRPSIPTYGSEVLEEADETSAQPEPSAQAASREAEPHINGTAAAAATGFVTSGAIPSSSHQNDLADLAPPEAFQPKRSSSLPKPLTPSRDNEGFSSPPPPSLDPISQAEAALTGESTQPQFNVAIRNTPIREEGDSVALETVANKLQAPPTNARRMGTVRGRRDARNSTVISGYSPSSSSLDPLPSVADPSPSSALEPFPSPPSGPAVQIPPASFSSPSPVSHSAISSPVSAAPVAFGAAAGAATGALAFSSFASSEPASAIRPTSRAAIGADYTGGDNQSVRSGRSLASTGSQGPRHADLHDTGLASSIIETVSARFANGQLTSSSVIGEIALAYNAADFSSPFGHETIRLDHFESLDKVAPNPAFLDSTSTGREGEYSVNLASISKTQIAFKYQLRQDITAAQVPLLVTPAFKLEPTQASVIVSYSLHPSFALPSGQSSVTLSNVTLALSLEGAKSTGCMSKPVGTFHRDRNLIYWSLGEVVLTSTPQKLLARFTTESSATGGSVDAKWELVSSGEATALIGSGLAVLVQSSSSVSGSAAPVGETDPFADDDAAHASSATAGWKRIPAQIKLTSGAYIAK